MTPRSEQPPNPALLVDCPECEALKEEPCRRANGALYHRRRKGGKVHLFHSRRFFDGYAQQAARKLPGGISEGGVR